MKYDHWSDVMLEFGSDVVKQPVVYLPGATSLQRQLAESKGILTVVRQASERVRNEKDITDFLKQVGSFRLEGYHVK